MPGGIVGGYLDTQNALQQQQSGQLQQALQLAQIIMEQRRAEHQQQMDTWTQDPNNPINRYHTSMAKAAEQNAQTNEQSRLGEVERQKAMDTQKEIQDAEVAGDRRFAQGQPFEVAYARVKRLDPDLYNDKQQGVFSDYRNRLKAKYDAQPAPEATPYQPPQIPTLPGAQFGVGAAPPPQAMGGPSVAPGGTPPPAQMMQGIPPEALQAILGGGGAAGMVGNMAGAAFAPQGGPPSPPPGIAPVAPPMGAPMGMPQGGPPAGVEGQMAQGPSLPPMMTTPTPTPFQEPTMADAMRQPSPYWAAQQEKMQSEERARAMREEAAKIRADAATTRAEAATTSSQANLTRAQTDQKALEQRVGRFANDATLLQTKNLITEERMKDLENYHQIMGKVAQRNAASSERRAATGEKNASLHAKEVQMGKQAFSIWNNFDRDAKSYEDDMRKNEDLANSAKKDMDTAWYQMNATAAQSGAKPTDEALSAQALASTRLYGDAKRKYEALKTRADDLRIAASRYRSIANEQLRQLQARGLAPTYSDGKLAPPGSVPRMPSTPRDKRAEVLRDLNIGP